MIIKMIPGVKSKKPSVLLENIRYAYDMEKIRSPYDGEVCLAKQFLRGYEPESWVEQILKNDEAKTYNNHIRRVILRKEVISFSPESSDYLRRNKKVLKELQREYMKRRSTAPGISITHYDQGHVHVHFLFGSTNVDSTSNRLNNEQMRAFKREMEEFQRTRFPELHHSNIEHGGLGKKKRRVRSRTHAEEQMKKSGVKTDKEELTERIIEIAKDCSDLSMLKQRMIEHSIEPYVRKGKVLTGAYCGKRRFRLTTLGVTKEHLKQMTKEEARLVELRAKRNKERDKEQDYEKGE